MFAYGIFKVLYAPHKAFKEIIQKPRYIGPILIMILLALAYICSAYVVLSRTYHEDTLPVPTDLDAWTENRTFWISNMNIAESDDALGGGYYGNKSIEFSTSNGSQLFAQLNMPEHANASGSDGFKKLSFRAKLLYPNTTTLLNASLFLYSSPENYFYYNLTESLISSNTTIWNNFTIAIGSDSEFVSISPDADWRNITRIEYSLHWSENANITMRLDGLFFRGRFKPAMENVLVYMPSFALVAFMQFVIQWVLLSGLLFLFSKGFGGKTVWKPLLILVGFCLITLFIQATIYIATYATLPTLYYPLELFGGVEGESQIAYNEMLNQTWFVYDINRYVQIAVYVWTILLCSTALHIHGELSWFKSVPIAVTAYFVSLFIQSFLFGF